MCFDGEASSQRDLNTEDKTQLCRELSHLLQMSNSTKTDSSLSCTEKKEESKLSQLQKVCKQHCRTAFLLFT